jgi:hypothetical protein
VGRWPAAATTTLGKIGEAPGETAAKLRNVLPRHLVIYTLVAVAVFAIDTTNGAVFAIDTTNGAVFAIDTTNGAVFIAPPVEKGTFTAREAVATMLVGGIVSFAVSTFRRSITFQFGIRGPTFGTRVVLVNTALKVVFIAAAVAALLVP